MKLATLLSLPCLMLAGLGIADDAKPKKKPGAADAPLFLKVTSEEAEEAAEDGHLVMGAYVLKRRAVRQLEKLDPFKQGFKRIRTTDWKAGSWTRKNADLTVRQLMGLYIQSASEFYDGKGRRPKGARGRRLMKYTDLELGDRQLVSALVTVNMASAWKIPLLKGQAESLDRVLRQRLKLLTPKKK